MVALYLAGVLGALALTVGVIFNVFLLAFVLVSFQLRHANNAVYVLWIAVHLLTSMFNGMMTMKSIDEIRTRSPPKVCLANSALLQIGFDSHAIILLLLAAIRFGRKIRFTPRRSNVIASVVFGIFMFTIFCSRVAISNKPLLEWVCFSSSAFPQPLHGEVVFLSLISFFCNLIVALILLSQRYSDWKKTRVEPPHNCYAYRWDRIRGVSQRIDFKALERIEYRQNSSFLLAVSLISLFIESPLLLLNILLRSKAFLAHLRLSPDDHREAYFLLTTFLLIPSTIYPILSVWKNPAINRELIRRIRWFADSLQ